MTYREAIDFCDRGIIPQYEKRDEPVVFELYQFIKQNNLKPSCITSYLRNAYFGMDYDSWLRVTFDTNIRYRKKNLDLANKEIGEFMVSPDKVIMEVKANERVPYWLTEMIASYNFRLIRVSKYCQGLEASEAVPRTIFYIADDVQI